ncbi:MAG: bifunctional folylpolyglutamate synthase/dihydrofolate synthase [Bacteroidales bacterium]|nr:bifunctional folylpolyglutamate synthase/dihydrofolate synthase [Bacteroidales bacterium]
MTYSQTIQFLYSQLPAYHRIGKAAYKNNLDNSLALDDYFSHPHLKYRTIHVAGTNGKGSVSHMIASVLREAGFITGLYTSPHLKDFRERIRVNGKMITKKEVKEFVERHIDIINSIKPSFFEMAVAMAFDYFALKGVDVAVIETGLGGRLDSTNIINPVLSVITNIGHDHMDLLGNSLEKVSVEKAGIIKKNVPVVIGETQPETENIFVLAASAAGSEISFADRNFAGSLEELNSMTGERQFLIADQSGQRKISGVTPLGGDYQLKNLQTVFQVFKSLAGVLNLSEKNIIDGIRKVILNTDLKGRWQILNHNPLTVCDTGHNKEGLEYVIRQIAGIPKTGLHMIIGFVSDKDISSILPLFPVDAEYYFTRASVPRALDEKILQSKALEYNLKGNSYPDMNKALKAARSNASETDLIFIGGSTFIVAEVV